MPTKSKASETETPTQHRLAAVLEKNPEAVLVPTQAFVRIEGKAGRKFEITTIAGTSEEDPTTFVLRDRDADGKRTFRRVEHGSLAAPERAPSTRLDTVPAWAYDDVAQLIADGELSLFETDEEAQRPMRVSGGLLEQASFALGFELTKTGTVARGVKGLTLETVARFSEPEQEIAYNILNGRIEGEAPIPAGIHSDPRMAEREEADIVEKRFRRSLEQPEAFYDKESRFKGAPVRLKRLLSALVECEFRGATPVRRASSGRMGGTRPVVVSRLIAVAETMGYGVTGDYVYEIQAEVRDLVPGDAVSI